MAQVTLFSDRQFAGSSVPLDEGDTRFSSDFNDTASSIRVAPGYCAMLYEHANEFSGYGAWVDLLEDCPDLAVYGFDKKTSYVHVFRAERDGFVWARGAMRDGQFIPGHWERKRASGVSPNSAVAVVAPPLPPRTTPLPAGDGVVIRDHRGERRFATFTMDSFGISNTRSLHNDTDFVYLSATVGANPPVFAKKSMGDVNNGTHSVGLSIEVDIPDDDTIVVFNYLIMNSGHGGATTRGRRPRRRRCPPSPKRSSSTRRSRRAPSPSARSWCRSSSPPSRRSPASWRWSRWACCCLRIATGWSPRARFRSPAATSSGGRARVRRFPRTPTILASIHRTAAAPTRTTPRPARSRRRLRSRRSWICAAHGPAAGSPDRLSP